MIRRSISVSMTAIFLALPAWAAPVAVDRGAAVSITADELAYDGATSTATGTGNVVITQSDKVLTGASGSYNTETGEAFLGGGVMLTGTNLSMTAAEVYMYDNNEIRAAGSVHLQKDDKEIFGEVVTYDNAAGYGVSEGNAKLVAEDAVITGARIEGWLNEIRATGTGGVTISSLSRNLYAEGDSVEYTQTPNENDGVAYLRGDAYAVQDGNTLRGNEFKIEMKDNSVETIGRSTLVITPKR